jgi:hypothetical protein
VDPSRVSGTGLPGAIGKDHGSPSQRCPEITVTRSVRHRALSRAAAAWADGYPHQAWQILTDAGCGDLWIKFSTEAVRQARATFVRLITP